MATGRMGGFGAHIVQRGIVTFDETTCKDLHEGNSQLVVILASDIVSKQKIVSHTICLEAQLITVLPFHSFKSLLSPLLLQRFVAATWSSFLLSRADLKLQSYPQA